MRKKVRERNSGVECVCSCSLVCLVQNWFKASGHRKRATLHSRHVPETSSRGSTIAIEQPRLQTPKWVCSVLQCPTWQSATYSTSLAPNMPSPSCCYFSIFSSSSSLSASFSLTSPLSVLVYFCPPLCMSVLFAHVFYLLFCHLFLAFIGHRVQLLCSDCFVFLYFLLNLSQRYWPCVIRNHYGLQMCSFHMPVHESLVIKSARF